jgi:hypothetical protein
MAMHSTKISGLAVDTEYVFHLVLRTSAGTYSSERVTVRTHKMTDLSGITITTGILPASTRDTLSRAVERIGAKIVDGVRIDTTHFVTTEGRGIQWEKAVEMNIPVVRPEWVEACEKTGRILGVTKFYLDALRPGPIGDEPSAPKDLPEPPAQKTSSDESVTQNGNGTRAAKDEPAPPKISEQEATEDEEDDDEPEDKVMSPSRDEQKIRADERSQQRLAVRQPPKQAVVDDDDEDDEDSASGKGARSPGDGSSFQDVAL